QTARLIAPADTCIASCKRFLISLMASARRAGRRAGSFKGVIDLHVKLSLCLGAALAALATPAFAQTDDARKPAEDGEIVVSGRYTLP
ncbi:hypothetical protein INQ15_24435, partial [Escherichia coli]|nr:hypothetical protein [Escherichia coli]